MNRIIKVSTLAIMFMIVACTQKNDSFETVYNSGWVQIDGDLSGSIMNTAPTFNIPIILFGGTNVNGIEITYTIELIEGTLNDSSILGSFTTSIPKNKKDGIISFTPIENPGNYKLKFTLSSIDDINYQVGLSDDSKPISFELQVCNFAVSNTYAASPVAFDAEAPAYTATLVLVTGSTNQYTIDSCWGPNFVAWATGDPSYEGQYVYSGILTINEDYTIDIIGDDSWATGGSGSYDPCTDTFEFTVMQELFSNDFTVTNILVGN